MTDRTRSLIGIAGLLIALLGPEPAAEASTRARQEALTTRDARLQSSIVTNAVAVTAGGEHSCALQGDGVLRCWGLNVVGELGDGTTAGSITPNVVTGGSGGISARDVSATNTHSCAVRASGTVACWGRNFSGGLGDGTTTTRLSPGAVSGLTNAGAVIVSQSRGCARRADGALLCWGENGDGQLGNGTTADRLTPVTRRPDNWPAEDKGPARRGCGHG